MSRRFAITAAIAVLSAASLVLSACGGGGDNVTEPKPRPPVDCTKTPEQCK